MKKFLLLGFSLMIINSNLFAGVKKEVDMKQFLSQLEAIQKQIKESRDSTKHIDNQIQIVNKQKQLDITLGNSKNSLIISKKVKKSISFLENYLFLLNKKIREESSLYGDSYYTIKGEAYLKVNQQDVITISDKIFKEKIVVLKIKKLLSLLKSLNSLGDKIYFSKKMRLLLNDTKNLIAFSQNNSNYTDTTKSNFKYDFCSINKKCFGYKVIKINHNEIILDF